MAKRKKDSDVDEADEVESISTDDLIKALTRNNDDIQISGGTSAIADGFVSSGSLAINRIMSGQYFFGGFPLGRITQIVGGSSSAKTVLGVHGLQSVQIAGGLAVFVDSEFAFSPEFARNLGLDTDRLMEVRKPTLEECFTTIVKLIENARRRNYTKPICIVYDSIAASPSLKEFKELMTKAAGNFKKTLKGDETVEEQEKLLAKELENYAMTSEVGHRGKVCSQYFRILSSLIAQKNVALIILNQTRANIVTQGRGPAETAAGGGKSLEFYCSVILQTRRTGKLTHNGKVDGRPIGISIKVKCSKNKVAVPYLEADEINLVFDRGIDPVSGVVALLAMDEKIVRDGKMWRADSPDFESVKFYEKNIAATLLEHPWIIGQEFFWDYEAGQVVKRYVTKEEMNDFLGRNLRNNELLLENGVEVCKEDQTEDD